MIDSRDINDLQPTLQRAAAELQRRAKEQGIDIAITSTYRDNEMQNSLYAQGRTKGGDVVTNVKGGYSYHNYGLAFDIAPIVNGKIDYNATNLYKAVGKIGQDMGLSWGGSWTGFVDQPHFEFTNGLKASSLVNGAKMPDMQLPWENGSNPPESASAATPSPAQASAPDYTPPKINSDNFNAVVEESRAEVANYAEKLPVDSGYRFNGIPKVSMHYPMVEIEIITEKENLVARGTITGDVETSEMVSDCLSVATKRDMGTDCPTFSITLVYKDIWFYKIGANDLVIIKMCRSPEPLTPVMFGLIDDIRKTVSFESGKPRRTISITGRGFGKGLVTFEAGAVKEYNLYSGALSYLGWLDSNINIAQMSAAGAIGELIDKYVRVYLDYNFGQGKTYNTFMRYHPIERPDEKLYDTSMLNDYQGSIWNLLKEFQNAPFNEMFWEIEDGFPTLFVRPTPFNPTEWGALKIITLEDTELVEDNVGRSDIETYTLYCVMCRFYGGVYDDWATLGFRPLWYRPYYDKYGIKRLNITSLYAAVADYGDAAATRPMLTSYTQDLFNWNIKNNSMFNGTIVAMGDVRYQIGCRLYHKSENMDYYIEGVAHSFTIYGSFTTQLAVTRGAHIGDRFTPPFGSGEELTSMEELRKTDGVSQTYFPANQNRMAVNPGANSNTSLNSNPAEGNTGNTAPSGSLGSPFAGKDWRTAISSHFGDRTNPISGKHEFHDGVDIAYPKGTPIDAIGSGVVIAVNGKSGYGNSVEIDHGNGKTSFYGHCNTVAVTVGQQINAGDVIATVGSTGYSTGPHLHMTVKENGQFKDPETYLP